MAHRVGWSRRALEDLESIATYIAADSPSYARAVVKKIVTLTRNLSAFSQSGRQVPEVEDDSILELIAYSYRIVYQLSEADVTIAAVIHGKRMLL